MTEAFSPPLEETASQVELETVERPQYAPLSSVWEGNDADLLERMFRFYASVPVEPILDATYNYGRFWKGIGAARGFDGHRPALQAHDRR